MSDRLGFKEKPKSIPLFIFCESFSRFEKVVGMKLLTEVIWGLIRLKRRIPERHYEKENQR